MIRFTYKQMIPVDHSMSIKFVNSIYRVHCNANTSILTYDMDMKLLSYHPYFMPIPRFASEKELKFYWKLMGYHS